MSSEAYRRGYAKAAARAEDDESELRERIAELEAALRAVVRDVNDYERANKLHPNPGRTECWDSVATAKAVLAKSTDTE